MAADTETIVLAGVDLEVMTRPIAVDAKRSITNTGAEIAREGRKAAAMSTTKSGRSTTAIVSGNILTKMMRSMIKNIVVVIVGMMTNIIAGVAKDRDQGHRRMIVTFECSQHNF